MGQHLQRHVLEGAGGAVPQLQAVGAVVHLLQGGHGGGVEFIGAVSLLGELPQLFGGEILQGTGS